MSVADSLLPPSSKIAFKASVTFARSSSEITLLSDQGASFTSVKMLIEAIQTFIDS